METIIDLKLIFSEMGIQFENMLINKKMNIILDNLFGTFNPVARIVHEWAKRIKSRVSVRHSHLN